MTVGHEPSCCAFQSMIRGMAHTAIAARTGHQVVHGHGCSHGRARRGQSHREPDSTAAAWRQCPRVSICQGRGALGAVGRASSACSHASHSGCWIKPGNGQRLWRACVGALGVGEVSGAMLGAWDHPTWMRRQSNPRATRRSWENPKYGAMTRSPLTEMKEDHSTAVTCARISRQWRVHHLTPPVMARATPRTSAQWGRAHQRSSALCVTPGHGLAGYHHHSRRDRYTEL